MKIAEVKACVFDAYGTLFDVNSSAEQARLQLGARWVELANLWRLKQLQYTWLRGLGNRLADFWSVTGDALDFAMASMDIRDEPLRERLMGLYRTLRCYPDVPDVLRELRSQGLRLAILSNGTSEMLASAVGHGGLEGLFDHVLSVEEVGVYKPHPSVYGLAAARLGMRPVEACFVSSNGWDACAAQANGFRAAWCNRTAQQPERIPDAPEVMLGDLRGLPDLLRPAL